MNDSRVTKGFPLVYYDTIQFYQNDNLIYQIVPRNNHYKWPVEIKDFKGGTYSVSYKNLYKERVFELVTISDTTSEYELNLYCDKLLDYPINSLQNLKKGETIKVAFSSLGCFNYNTETLIILKQNNSFVAKWTDGTIKKTITLNQLSIDAFKRFENEVREVKDGCGCTTVDRYTVISKNTTIKKVDDGCKWDGFYFLKKVMFGKTK